MDYRRYDEESRVSVVSSRCSVFDRTIDDSVIRVKIVSSSSSKKEKEENSDQGEWSVRRLAERHLFLAHC